MTSATYRVLPLWLLTGCGLLITEADDAVRPTTPSSPDPLPPPGAASVHVVAVGNAPDPAAPAPGPTDRCLGFPEISRITRPLGTLAVEVAGASADTDGAGHARLPDVTPGAQLVAVQVPGWTPAYVPLTVTADRTAYASLSLVPVTSEPISSPAHGGSVGVDCQYAFAFPAGAFGEAVAVDVAHAWVPAGVDAGPPKNDANGVPLDLVALAWVEGSVSLVTPGTWRASISDGLDVLAGVEGRALWYFDPAQGSWVSNGPLVEESATGDPKYLAGTIDRWGWWAIGAPEADLGCMTGSAEGPGGGEVSVTSSRRPGRWRVEPDDDGAFCAPTDPVGDTAVRYAASDAASTTLWSATAQGPVALLGRTCGGDCEPLADALVATAAVDADLDGYPAGIGGDCDDEDSAKNPDAVDAVGGGDQNCDGIDGVDADRDGVNSVDEDCDADPARYPDRMELCNAIDDDCDGAADHADVSLSEAATTKAATCVACTSGVTQALQPKLYWRLAAVSPTAHDSSGFGNDAEVFGLEERYPGITDQEEEAPLFPGTLGDYARLSQFDEMGTTELTIALWIRPQVDRRSVLSYAVPADPLATNADAVTNAANEVGLTLANGGIKVVLKDQQVLFEADQAPIPLGTWSHLAVTWRRDDANVTVFVDGAETYSQLLTLDEEEKELELDPSLPPLEAYRPDLVAGGSFYLGQNQDAYSADDAAFDSWQAFQGMVDELAIFDRALEEYEIEQLFLAATCGEVCDGGDNDGDGLQDEHLLGSAECPGLDCAAIVENGASMGDGTYDIIGSEAFCDMDAVPLPATHFCGDGEIFNDAEHPVESCDGAVSIEPECLACDACACVTTARDCEELATQGFTANGPYWIRDPLDSVTPLLVRCLMDQNEGGWTLVHSHDSALGTLFALDPDPVTEKVQLDVLAANVGDPFAGGYSILGRLGALAGPQGFEFRMTWPQPVDYGQVYLWRQSSNPAESPAAGYAAISVPDPAFAGLAFRDDLVFIAGAGQPACTVDCIVYYSVGLYLEAQEASPEYADYKIGAAPPTVTGDGTARHVELWTRPWE